MNVREKREALGLTRDKLAHKLGVSVRTIQRHEKGERDENWYKLALDALFTKNELNRKPVQAIGGGEPYQSTPEKPPIGWVQNSEEQT